MKKIITYLILLFTCISINMVGIAANEEPIHITVTTNKESYNENDEINIQIQVENTSESDGKDMIVTYLIPDGIKIVQSDGKVTDNKVTWNVDKIASKGKAELKLSGTVEKHINSNIIENNTNKPTVENADKAPAETGDYTNLIVITVVFFTSIIILCVIFNKYKKIFKMVLILGVTFSAIPLQRIKGESTSNHYENDHNIKVQNKVLKGKVYVDIIFVEDVSGDVPGSITLDNELNEYNVVTSDQNSIMLTGTATDRNGIDRIEYNSKSVTGIEKKGNADGKENWKINLEAENGTSNITVKCIDTLGNTTSISFKVNRLTNKIQLNDKVVFADKTLKELFSNELIDVIYSDEDNSFDLIFSKESKFVELVKKEDSGLGIDSVLYVDPDEIFITGFTKKINSVDTCDKLMIPEDHIFPEGVTSYTDQYSYIHMVEPSFKELYKSDVSLDFSKMYVNENEPVAFVAYGDGSAVKGNPNEKVRISRFVEKGFQTDSLKEIFKIKNEKYTGNKGIKKLGLDFDDVVIYDADGNQKTTTDQLKISGECGLDNIKIGGGIEWHPSLTDILPQQIKYELKFDQINNISTTVGMDFNSKDFVANANKSLGFTNETKGILNLIDISGIKLDDRIYLGTVGVNIFTGALEYGTLGSISKIDKSILIPLNFFLEVDINGKINFYLEAGYNSYNRLGFNIQKKGFDGSYGTIEQNKSKSTHKNIGDFVLDLYNESAKSKADSSKPEAYLTGEIAGSLNARIGAGIDSGIMILGIIPASAGVSMSVNTKAEGKFKGTIYSDHDTDIEISGKANILGTLDGMYNVRLAINDNELFSEKNRLTLWKFFEKNFEIYKGVKGTAYINDKNQEKLKPLSGVNIKFKNKSTGTQFEMNTDVNGVYLNEDVVAGMYEVIAYKDGYAINSFEVQVGLVNMTPIDLFMEPINEVNATGYIYATVPENTLYPQQNVANAEIHIYENNVLVKTVFSNANGYYSVGNLPVGKYEIEAIKEGYIHEKEVFEYGSFDTHFSIHMIKLPDVIMKAGDTYRFTGVGSSPYIYVVSDGAKGNAADYSDNLRKAIIGSKMKNGWISVNKNKNYDITVISGEVKIYYTAPGSREEITGKKIDHEALKIYTLTTGESMTIKADRSIGIWGYRPITYKLIEGSATLTQFYNTTQAKDKPIVVGKVDSSDVWGLEETSTNHYQVHSGTLQIAIRYDDLEDLHIN